jgi:hypothetical protein
MRMCVANFRRANKHGVDCMRLSITAVVAIFIASRSFAAGDGFEPCEADVVEDDSYYVPLDSSINGPSEAKVSVSFTAIPSFDNEWGVRLIRSGDSVILRAVDFDFSVFHSAYQEIRPGTFARKPALARYDHSLHEVAIDHALARLLEEEIAQQIAGADPSNARCVFDGDSYYFRMKGTCGSTCSPPWGSRAERLVDAFYDLKTQASLPTRWFQLFWEKRTLAKLLVATGRERMPVSDYVLVFLIGLTIVAVAALPLLVACLVAFFPTRLQRKAKFVLTCGMLSYGATCLIAVCALPFLLTGLQLAAQAPVGEGAPVIPMYLLKSYAKTALFWCWMASSVGVPVYLRRAVWPQWTNAVEQIAAGHGQTRAPEQWR